MNSDLERWQEAAIAAVKAAGFHALSQSRRRTEVAQSFAHDVKLQLDLECQACAEAVLKKMFPAHGILGEEGRASGGAGAPLWIIDPIDGTVNFFHGMPLWCSSVAVQWRGRICAGAVFAPELDALYTAHAEGPAFCNDQPIHASSIKELKDAMALAGLGKHIHDDPAAFQLLKELALRAQKVRAMGSAALDICHVACGRAEAYYESGVHLWDIAAAGLIAERAGARSEILETLSEFRYRYLCANGPVFDEIKALIMTFAPSQG